MLARGESVQLDRFYLLPGFLDTYNIGIAPLASP